MTLLSSGRPTRKNKAISEVQKNNADKVRINANIDNGLYRTIKIMSFKRDTTITSIVVEALHDYLDKISQDK